MLSPCRVPSHTRPVFHARRNTAYGTQHSAGNTPYVLSAYQKPTEKSMFVCAKMMSFTKVLLSYGKSWMLFNGKTCGKSVLACRFARCTQRVR